MAVRSEVEASTTYPEASYGTTTVELRTAMEKSIEASAVLPSASSTVHVDGRRTRRHEIDLSPYVTAAGTYDVSVLRTIPQPMEFQAAGVYLEPSYAASMNVRTMAEIQIDASETHAPASYTTHLLKGAAMPPGMVLGLILLRAGYRTVQLQWMQPDLGTGLLTGYEYRIGSGAWRPTQSTDTRYVIQNLDPGTQYSISIRAATTVGRGPGSTALVVTTLTVEPPAVPRFARSSGTGARSVDVTWTPPADDGGSTVLYYEIIIIDEDGIASPFERTSSAVTSYRVRGLGFGHRYGFRVRAVNSAGPGSPTGILYTVPVRSSVTVIPPGQRIPLDDHDRQAVIVRLADRDCRITVWWARSDDDGYGNGGGWWGSLEVPVNTPVVQSRRLSLNAGILDRVTDVLPGFNLVLRELGDSGAEPSRDAWSRPTHALVFERTT